MTKPFAVRYTCPHCGGQASAETAFGRWMRARPELDSREYGVIRTDTDHTVMRYKGHGQGRGFLLFMELEVKERGAEPDAAQLEMLRIRHQIVSPRGKNMHGASTTTTHRAKSFINGVREVFVRHYGVHLLQFSDTCPDDSTWIKWDRVEITPEQLIALLRFDLDPTDTTRTTESMLRDRHKAPPADLFRGEGDFWQPSERP